MVLRQAQVAIGTGAAIAAALVAQQLTARQPYGLWGWAIYLFAAGLIVVVTWRGRDEMVSAALPQRPALTRQRLWLGAGACGCLVLTTALSAINRWPLAVLLLWFTGFGVATAALRAWVITPPAPHTPAWSRREILRLAVIVGAAALPRLLWIDALPRYYFGDEARVGVFLQDLYRAGIPNFFTMGWNTWPVIGLSVQGLFAPLLGLSTATLRLSSALMGTLAVGATYLLARQLYGARVALLSAVLLAICRTAIDFSRLGTCHAQVMLLEPLAFFLWWRAADSGRATAYLWAGIGLAACLFSYNAGQSAPVLWLGWLLLCAVRAPRLVRSHWRGVGLTAAGFVLAFFPYFFYATDYFAFGHNWNEFTMMARNRQVLSQAVELLRTTGLSAAGQLLERQVLLTWLGFTVFPAGAYALGYRGGGMLDNVTAPLFILGLAMSVPRLLRGREAFVPYWWVVTTIIGGVLTADPPAVVRLVGLVPALAILAALPLDWVLRVAGQVSWRGVAGIATVAVLLCGAARDTWRTYFIEFAQATVDDTSELARHIKELPPATPVLVLGSEHFLRVFADVNLELFPFEFPERRVQDVPDPAHALPLRDRFTVPPVIVLAPSQATLAGYVRQLYPRTTVTDVTRGPQGPLLFRMLTIDADDIAGQAGLQRRAYGRDGSLLGTVVADPGAGTEAVPTGCVRFTWSGSIYWPTAAAAEFRLESAVPVDLRIGHTVVRQATAGGSVSTSITLPRGWHPLSLEQSGCQALGVSLAITDAELTRFVRRSDLRPDAVAEGLTATYVRPGRQPLHVIDPQINAFAVEDFFRPPNQPTLVTMPFRATWQGFLHVPVGGEYEFEAHGSGPYSVALDGEPLFEVPAVVPEEPQVRRTRRVMTAGSHALRAAWDSSARAHTSRRLFQLYWMPPGGERELIPPTAFSPGGE